MFDVLVPSDKIARSFEVKTIYYITKGQVHPKAI